MSNLQTYYHFKLDFQKVTQQQWIRTPRQMHIHILREFTRAYSVDLSRTAKLLNIRTLVGNKIDDNSDIVGASPILVSNLPPLYSLRLNTCWHTPWLIASLNPSQGQLFLGINLSFTTLKITMRTWCLIRFTSVCSKTLKILCFRSSLVGVISHVTQLTYYEQNDRHFANVFFECILQGYLFIAISLRLHRNFLPVVWMKIVEDGFR